MKQCKQCNKEFEMHVNGAGTMYCSDACTQEVRRKRNRERWRKENPDWNKDLNKKCEWCNKEFEASPRHKHAKFCSEKCRDTFKSRVTKGHREIAVVDAERKERKAERNKAKQLTKARLNINKVLNKVIKHKEKELEKIKKENELTKECIVCNEIFIAKSRTAICCSYQCGRKRNNAISRITRRNRISKEKLIDRGITIERLSIRDNDICHICGGVCNFDDKMVTKRGYTIVGDTYPSVDHVIPISKNGEHSWSNVKLAHFKCNTLKRDNLTW